MKDPNVLFAGYKNPHPLTYKIELTVKTKQGVKAEDCLKEALKSIQTNVKEFSEEFHKNVTDILQN